MKSLALFIHFLPTIASLASSAAAAASSSSTFSVQATSEHSLLRHIHQQRILQARPKTIQKYELWEPAEIKQRLLKWSDHYSDFIRVTTAQEAFGLPAAGTSNDCQFDDQVSGCLNYFFVIQDFETYPEGSEESRRLPEVLWSGEVHGNEQVGPTSVLEAADLLLSAASCESLPRHKRKDQKSYEKEVSIAESCRQELADFGINDKDRKWLARLVSTRRIVVVPTANALGYARKKREEDRIDPNRDFPYDVVDPRKCMQTIAGRTLNEVFRQHMFQLSLTFHGGMEVVGYEWGAPSWEGHLSPDHEAQREIGSAYSGYGGSFSSSPAYNSGTMNKLVYPVTGGMEDWAYAGSWDPKRVIQCDPTTYGGYPKEKTTYSNSTLRAFNMLVETSNRKIPTTDLGTSEGVMRKDAPGNGHISRNIRLALLAAELVEPYLVITRVNDFEMTDDVVPLEDHSDPRSCQQTRGVTVPSKTSHATVEWTVGGALTVDDTELWYARWDDVKKLDCWSQPNADGIESFFQVATQIGSTSGNGFSGSTTFKANIDLSPFSKGDRLVVLTLAQVDQDWATQPENIAPNVPPQSHVVNARTNPDWYHETDGSIIQGRLKWFSRPFTIQIDDSAGGNIADIKQRLLPLPPSPSSDGSSSQDDSSSPGTSPSSGGKDDKAESGSSIPLVLATVIVLLIVALAGRSVLQHRFRTAKRNRVMDFIEDEDAESPGLQNGRLGKGYYDAPDEANLELT